MPKRFDPICEKCGSESVGIVWRAEEKFKTLRPYQMPIIQITPEYFQCHCFRCGFSWHTDVPKNPISGSPDKSG